MMQLLLHLTGDYILQTNWMAINKTKSSLAALSHAAVYSVPFLILDPSIQAFAVILITHFFIDRFRLARYVVFAKNWIDEPDIKWKDCSETGYHKDSPAYLSVWLLIITDNTLHLWINFLSLKYL